MAIMAKTQCLDALATLVNCESIDILCSVLVQNISRLSRMYKSEDLTSFSGVVSKIISNITSPSTPLKLRGLNYLDSTSSESLVVNAQMGIDLSISTLVGFILFSSYKQESRWVPHKISSSCHNISGSGDLVYVIPIFNRSILISMFISYINTINSSDGGGSGRPKKILDNKKPKGLNNKTLSEDSSSQIIESGGSKNRKFSSIRQMYPFIVEYKGYNVFCINKESLLSFINSRDT